MKEIRINVEVAKHLVSNISVLKSTENAVRFTIGLQNLGNGLAAQAIVVNGGQMANIGFATSLPEDKKALESLPYLTFAVKAEEFCNVVSVLCDYNSDLTLSCDGKRIFLSVGSQVSIPMGLVSPEACEPLLNADQLAGFKDARVKFTLKGDDFRNVFQRGVRFSSAQIDMYSLTDRVAVRMENGKCFLYSTDGHGIGKSWTDVNIVGATEVNTGVNQGGNGQHARYCAATCFLMGKGYSLDQEGQKELMLNMRKYQQDETGMIAYAKEHGFNIPDWSPVMADAICYLYDGRSELPQAEQMQVLGQVAKNLSNEEALIAFAKEKGFVQKEREPEPVSDKQECTNVSFALPYTAVAALQKYIDKAENVGFIVTENYLHLSNGLGVKATFSLAGEVPSVYSTTVDPWENATWSAKAVIDKDELGRALGVLRLDTENTPVSMKADENGLVLTKGGNEVHLPLVAKEGNLYDLDSYLGLKYLQLALSTLSSGNVVLRFVTGDAGARMPISISNGSLEEDCICSYCYIIPSKKPVEEPAEEETSVSEADKNSAE